MSSAAFTLWSRRPLASFACAATLAVTAPCASLAPAMAAELRVLSGNGARAAVRALGERFERATGHRLVIEVGVNSAVQRRIENGEAFDLAVLNPPVLDALIRQGLVVPDSRAVLGSIGIGVGVRAGAPRPDISSVEAFRATLLAATSVAYPGEGASGIHFAGVVERLGLAAAMHGKLKPMPAEDTVEVVARGEAQMVVVVASRMVGVPGIEVVGPIPAPLQARIGFAAGVGTRAHEAAAARELARFMTAPAAAPILRGMGIEPFVE
jgi:molybdate transport system substrate-binding protein